MSILDTGFGRVLHDRHGVSIHQFQELMVVVYRSISLEGLKAVGSAQRQLHEAHGRIAGLSVLRPEALTRPDPAVRAAGQAISDEFDLMAYASAIVLTEAGMGGAFYRSILTGIHLASRRPVPQKVFASSDDAVTFVLGKNPHSSLAPRVVEVQRRVAHLVQSAGDKSVDLRGR
ncbi:MAG: hypothetical protein J0L92_31475 [Deltaproteobacteria bacterium]|nr:hypothetical protein [Deltaproteobacteria bacterium]